jgi:hypothetical protein
MSRTPARCEHDGIKWFPRVTVEKYSPDQSAWAERKLHNELSWGRRLLVETLGVRVPRLHGDWLREVFREPEDGFAHCQGNSLVNGGLDKLTGLLVASSPVSLMPNAQAICGVGTDSTATVPTQTHLAPVTGEGAAATFYQQMDATYPLADGTTHGQLDGQATFVSTSANFASGWVEWCWASTTAGAITAGNTLSGLSSGTETMFNRWTGTTLGTKGAGATWVFSTTISFSLGRKYRLTCCFVKSKATQRLGFSF